MGELFSSIFIGVYLAIIIALTFITWWKKWYVLNHENLFNQKLFWIVILTPTFSFLYFGIFSWLGHKPQLNSEGMNNFLNITKLPLFILASVVPLGAIVSNLHRTYQMEAQIKNSESKNNLDAFYAHYKYHTESLSKICSDKKITHLKHEKFDELISLKMTIKKPHSLYQLFFPSSSPINGPDYTPSQKVISLLIKRIDELTSSILELDEKYLTDKINNGIKEDDEKLKSVRKKMLDLCTVISIDEDIREINFLDLDFENNYDKLRANFIRIRILCLKIDYMLKQSLSVIGVTKKINAGIFDKLNTLKKTFNIQSEKIKNIASSLNIND
ncbi:hypothetical protein K8W40_001407 [Escherichia coli]|nr:hypothetical protein [Escherichia coli]